MVMEESRASNEINAMMNNIENNGAPWPFNRLDRLTGETKKNMKIFLKIRPKMVKK